MLLLSQQQVSELKAEAEELATRNKSLLADVTRCVVACEFHSWARCILSLNGSHVCRYQNVVVPELEARARDKDQRLSEMEERHNRAIKEAAHRARAEAEKEAKELEKVEFAKREQLLKVRQW